jgi:rhodanese-related sulfurtransferase
MRRGLGPALAALLLLAAAPPAGRPEHPVSYIGVDELKSLLDRGIVADIIDVRTRPEFDRLHIKGARSIPLRDIPGRAGEIPKNRLVVFY